MSQPFFVEGEAGSGKTTRLMQQTVVSSGLLISGIHQSVLAMAVMHGARRHLHATLRRLCGTIPVTVSTIHSFGLKIANRWRRSLGLSLPLTICESSCGFAKQNGFTHLTFDEVMQLACQLVESATVRSIIGASHPVVIVDEFQDCSGDILKFVQSLGRSTKLLLAADHFQLLTENKAGCAVVDWILDLKKQGRVDVEELAHCNRTDSPAILRAARALRDNVKSTQPTVPVYYGHVAGQVAYRIVERFAWKPASQMTDGSYALIALSLEDVQLTKLLTSFHTQLAKKTKFRVNWSQESSVERDQQELFSELGISDEPSPGAQWRAEKNAAAGKHASRVSQDVVRFCRLRGIREIPQELVIQIAKLSIHNSRAYSKTSKRFQVLTVHGAKNREFDHVFVFWGYKKSGWSVEHQRRLLYNAVTRAKVDCTVLFLGNLAKVQSDPVISLLGPAQPAINPEWGKRKSKVGANSKTKRQ